MKKYYVILKATAEATKEWLKSDGATCGFVFAKTDKAAQIKADKWFYAGDRADSFSRNGFVVTVKAA